MKIFIKAKPGAKQERVTQMDAPAEGLFDKRAYQGAGDRQPVARPALRFMVSVKEPAVDGRANRAIEKALAAHFKVPLSFVRIVRGHSAKEKIVEIAKGGGDPTGSGPR